MAATGLKKKDELESYFKDVSKSVKEKWQPRNDRIDEIWARRLRTHEPNIPDGFKVTAQATKLPLVGDLIRRAQAIIATKLPTAYRRPLAKGTDAQELADHIEMWFNEGAYPTMLRREDTFAQITDAMANDGEAVWKLLYMPHSWAVQRDKGTKTNADGEVVPNQTDAQYNAAVAGKHQSKFPFEWTHVDTRTYYPLATDDEGVSEVLEITEREARSIADKYNLVPSVDGTLVSPKDVGAVIDRDAPFPAKCKFGEYWNRTHFAYFVDGKEVRRGKHDYGRPPYFHAPFSTTSSKDPGFLTESIADPVIPIQDKLDNFITAMENWIWLASFPSMRLRPVSEEAIPTYDNKAAVKITIGPGKIIEGVPFGQIPEWVPPPPIGNEVNSYRDMLMEIYNRVTLSPILYAEIKGQLSGPVATSLIAIARAIFGPGLTNLARAFDEMSALMLYIIETQIKEPVPVWVTDETDPKKRAGTWLELDPKDIEGYYLISHNLEPIIPMEQHQNLIMMETLFDRGLIPPRMLLEQGANIANPEDVLEERMTWDIGNSPDFKNALIMPNVLRRLGAEAPGAPPNAGTPPGPPAQASGPVPQMPQVVPQGPMAPDGRPPLPNGAP